MARERLYVVAYDIAGRKRRQKVFNTMKGYGHWLQLSVFQCRLTIRRRFEMTERLEEAIKSSEDHVVILNLGPAGLAPANSPGPHCSDRRYIFDRRDLVRLSPASSPGPH